MDGETEFTVGAQENDVLFENASAVLAVLQHRGDRSTEALSKHLRPGLRARHRQQRPAILAGAARGLEDIVRREFAGIRAYHPGLQKALTYLAHHYAETISLSRLAQQACLSRSHLSYLFKQLIGVSFKPFLAAVRIEKARRFLVEKPHFSVTRIGGEVGFGDLRHFERTFKRWAGSTPRAYRQRALLS